MAAAAEHSHDLLHPFGETLGIFMSHPNSITQRDCLTTVGLAKTAQIAFAVEHISISGIQVAKIYSCFTFVVLCQLEDLGFCEKGAGGDFVMEGKLRWSGSMSTNIHGGLFSHAHMLGMNHIVQLMRQLPGRQSGCWSQDCPRDGIRRQGRQRSAIEEFRKWLTWQALEPWTPSRAATGMGWIATSSLCRGAGSETRCVTTRNYAVASVRAGNSSRPRARRPEPSTGGRFRRTPSTRRSRQMFQTHW